VSNPLTIGVDTGTSGCKAVLIDERGRVLASSWRTYRTRRGMDGEVTQDPADWVRAAVATIRECTQAAGRRPIEAIGVTAPAHAAVLVDTEGEPLTHSLLAFDGRPVPAARRLRETYGERFFSMTFVALTEGWTFPQLAWLRSERAELWPRIRVVLPEKDYVVFCLTGAVSTDPSDAQGTAMVDQTLGEWAEDLCAEVGLSLQQLPPIRSATERAGGIKREWARRTGLPEGTPVIVGATDTAAELVSIGAFEAGASLIKAASTGVVAAVSERPRPDPAVLTYPHALPGLWYTLAATSTAATAYRWLSNVVFGRSSPDGYFPQMNRLAARVAPGADGLLFLPFLEGERSPHWDRDLRAAFLGVASAHGRAHLCRAVLEGVGYSLRSCRELLAGLGLRTERPDFTGGGFRSSLWRTIVASILQLEGTVPEPQGPAVGVGLLAAGGVPPRPQRRLVRPRPDWVSSYDEIYEAYVAATEQVAEISHTLARIAVTSQEVS
jgi:xylulokinase